MINIWIWETPSPHLPTNLVEDGVWNLMMWVVVPHIDVRKLISGKNQHGITQLVSNNNNYANCNIKQTFWGNSEKDRIGWEPTQIVPLWILKSYGMSKLGELWQEQESWHCRMVSFPTMHVDKSDITCNRMWGVNIASSVNSEVLSYWIPVDNSRLMMTLLATTCIHQQNKTKQPACEKKNKLKFHSFAGPVIILKVGRWLVIG